MSTKSFENTPLSAVCKKIQGKLWQKERGLDSSFCLQWNANPELFRAEKTIRFKLSCAQTPCVLHPLDAGYAKTSRWLARFPDRSHVSIKHIAGIEKGQKNPSFEILQALAEALDLSLDNLIEKNLSAEEQGLNQLKAYYHSCPPEMRETLLNTIQAFTKELTALAEKMDKD